MLTQVFELQQALGRSEAERAALQAQLVEKDQALAQAERDRAAAELTVHTLAMRLAARAT